MAITFNKLKSPLLAPTDLITVGKLKDCRVCDAIPDHFEYLIWADKQGFLKFTGEVIETLKEFAFAKNKQIHYEEEIAPYTKEYDEPSVQELDFSEDVPF